MKIKTCLKCGCVINPGGSRQAHRKMYCSPYCKDAYQKMLKRRRAKGLPMPWEEGGVEPSKPKVVKVCENCRRPYEVPDTGRADLRRYCSDECEDEARRKRRMAAYYAARCIEKMQMGSFALAADPWATGQLPAEVRRNALWA